VTAPVIDGASDARRSRRGNGLGPEERSFRRWAGATAPCPLAPPALATRRPPGSPLLLVPGLSYPGLGSDPDRSRPTDPPGEVGARRSHARIRERERFRKRSRGTGAAVDERLADLELPARQSLIYGGQWETIQETQRELAIVVGQAFFLVLVVLAVQYERRPRGARCRRAVSTSMPASTRSPVGLDGLVQGCCSVSPRVEGDEAGIGSSTS
jgi:hypothetical protein